jgi:crossover junction endodeoxyribonuclease RusA
MSAIALTLPFPPSSNYLWRHVNGRTLIALPVRNYRKAVNALVLQARSVGGPLSVGVTGLYLPLAGRLTLTITLFAANSTRRDLDNHIKVVQDALTCAGVWRDDSQIDVLYVIRGAMDRKNPRLEIVIGMIGEPA